MQAFLKVDDILSLDAFKSGCQSKLPDGFFSREEDDSMLVFSVEAESSPQKIALSFKILINLTVIICMHAMGDVGFR